MDFYSEVQDLDYLVARLNSNPFTERFVALNRAIAGLVTDFSLVSFQLLSVEDKQSMHSLIKVIDKSNGFIYGGLSLGNESVLSVAEGESEWNYDRTMSVQDQYGFDLE